MAYKIAFANQKGGVGKTTSVKAVSGELAKRGKKVLIIDADPSANSTSGIAHEGSPQREYGRIIADYCQYGDEVDPHMAIVPTNFENLFLMPGSATLDISIKCIEPGKEDVMKRLFSVLDDEFDYIIIDSLAGRNSPLTVAAFTFVDYVLIPIMPDQDSLDAFSNTVATIKTIKDYRYNPNIQVMGTFLTMVNKSRRQDKDLIEGLQSIYEDKYIPCQISYSMALATSSRNSSTPFCFLDPAHKVTREYSALVDIIMDKVGDC